jgi:hypothetical protein
MSGQNGHKLTRAEHHRAAKDGPPDELARLALPGCDGVERPEGMVDYWRFPCGLIISDKWVNTDATLRDMSQEAHMLHHAAKHYRLENDDFQLGLAVPAPGVRVMTCDDGCTISQLVVPNGGGG